MIRFFVDPAAISGGVIQLGTDDSEHIRSLRLRPEEQFIVCDGSGSDHVCRLGARSGGSVAEIIETRSSRSEPTVECSVFIAIAKGDRLEYAVQKSTELGAHDIVLFPSERCVSIPVDLPKKITRLRRIVLETAKQCGRGRIPDITAAGSFIAAVGQAARVELPLFLYESEDMLHLKQALIQRSGARTISIVTGPEGGFEPHEAESAREAGMITVTLGLRILRCETAPAAALAAVMFHTDNL